ADGQLPVIGQQPQSRYFCEGTNASFSVTATNAVSYQWQQWVGSSWTNIAGATSSTLTINSVSMSQNAATYRVLVIGLCTTVPSAAASYYVNPTPSVSISATQLNLIPGRMANLVSSVSLPGGTYRWFRNGTQLTNPLQQGPVLNGITIDGAGTYRLTYTDPNGCSNSSSDLVIKAEPSTKLWAYPNPTTGRITLRYYDIPDGKAFIVVYDEKGSLLIQRPFVTSNPYGGMELDLAPPGNAPARSFVFPSGNYVIVLYSQSGIRLGATKVMVHRD
ncbi:MAG: hypothetical protein RJA57_2015, partial [Bacteroidota bacterium]